MSFEHKTLNPTENQYQQALLPENDTPMLQTKENPEANPTILGKSPEPLYATVSHDGLWQSPYPPEARKPLYAAVEAL